MFKAMLIVLIYLQAESSILRPEVLYIYSLSQMMWTAWSESKRAAFYEISGDFDPNNDDTVNEMCKRANSTKEVFKSQEKI